MDCSRVASVLVAYHFATGPEDERALVDEHLVSCRECLTSYLALKRAVDREHGRDRERPSDSMRANLRAAVAREFGRAPARPLWTRRIPLYQGVFAAAAAAALALALALPRFSARSPSHQAPSAAVFVDTSRPVAASLAIY